MAARFSDPEQVTVCIQPGRKIADAQPFAGFAERTPAGPRWTGRVELIQSKLNEPLRWRKPARVFVNSMSDLFHERLSDADIIAVFDVMRSSGPDSHTFQILTKRPDRMRDFCGQLRFNGHGEGRTWLAPSAEKQDGGYRLMGGNGATGMPWVWLGVSVENQATADERIPLLLQTPAAVRFVSYEPALGPVDFSVMKMDRDVECYPLTGEHRRFCAEGFDHPAAEEFHAGGPKIDWLIVGGESGPGARACDVDWIRSAVRQAKAAAVPVFVKQLGANYCDARNAVAGRQAVVPEEYTRGPVTRLRDPKGGDPSEWPEDLRIREFPNEKE